MKLPEPRARAILARRMVHVPYLFSRCGRVGEVEIEDLNAVTSADRDSLLARSRCRRCGCRAVDLKIGWAREPRIGDIEK